ncbi:peptidoglycan DD-metalloendopeptidase family protein [Geitlerinema sp. CS-897]|nr:peptidoglycan DD-metalloendopeptidase family protein [Geitlerinema sp. CS-897]
MTTQLPLGDVSRQPLDSQRQSRSDREQTNPYLNTKSFPKASEIYPAPPRYRPKPKPDPRLSLPSQPSPLPTTQFSTYHPLYRWARQLEAERAAQIEDAEARIAALKDRHENLLADDPHLWWELVVLFLAALGISWGYISFFATPSDRRASNAIVSLKPTPQLASQPLPPRVKDIGDAPIERQVQLKGEKTPLATQPLSESKLPLARSTQTFKGAIDGIAKKLPPDLEKPVTDNQRIAGYRVTDVFLPCQAADYSDCRAVHPVYGSYSVPHWGVDIAMPYGAPLRAVGQNKAAVRVACSYKAGGGLTATMYSDSFPEYEFRAMHLSDCLPGTYEAGDIVAAVGSSGGTTGPHLHWEAKFYDRHIDPPRWSIEYVIKGDIVLEIPKKYTY